MRKMAFIFIFLIFASISAQPIPKPIEFFGFEPGSDRELFTYDQLISYLSLLDKNSSKIKMQKIGTSPMGKAMYIAFISSADNLKNLEKLRIINRELALNPDLSKSHVIDLIAQGKVFVLGTLSMHSGEVGPAQAAPRIAYELITSNQPGVQRQLEKVVYMMVPNHNPDGMDMVVQHYKKYKNTIYEGSSMPGVYHKYVGHDNNRDFVILSQSDTKAIARIYNLDWYPQVMVEKHQMGSYGPRYYVPPNHDPIAENIDAGIWNWSGLFGANMIKDMTAKDLSGISQHYLFDDYWPGSTETCIWKNVIGFLTEAASAKYAKPVFVEPNELRVYGKGLSEYKKSINMPLPWPGGWWRLSDIIEYEKESTYSIIKTAAKYHSEILTYRNDICRSQVELGQTQAPYFYVLPLNQHDQSELVDLVHLLREHGVEVYNLTQDVLFKGTQFRKGDIIVPLAQPFRPFVKEVLERQKYPVRHYTPGGEIIKPYDITSWSLPLHKGLQVFELNTNDGEFENTYAPVVADYNLKNPAPQDFDIAVFDAVNNESYQAAFWALSKGLKVDRLSDDIRINDRMYAKGSFLIESTAALSQFLDDLHVSPGYLKDKPDINYTRVDLPKIGLIETYFHDMDAGWTRFIFDTYHIPFTVLRPADLKEPDQFKKYDLLVFPDARKSILESGKWKSKDSYYVSNYPPEYTKGMAEQGKQNVFKFINSGGRVISWGQSTALFGGMQKIEHSKSDIEEFQLPVNDVSAKLKKDGLYCPGSLVKIHLLPDHPLTLGMQKNIGVFYRGRPAFTTSIPVFDMDRRVIARFPEENILMSGYCENEELLADKTALTWIKKGKGTLTLFAFNPQFRASTPVSYKLLFNAILLDTK